MLHVVRARGERRVERHRAAGGGAGDTQRRRRRGRRDPQRRAHVGRIRNRRRAHDVGLQGDRHDRKEDNRADADEGVRGGVRRRVGGGGGVKAGAADIGDPHARGGSHGGGVCERV